jgi:hypothetical protein
LEVHLAIANGLIGGSLIECSCDSDCDISHIVVVVSREGNLEVAVLPSTYRAWALDSLVSHVSKVVSLELLLSHDIASSIRHLNSKVLIIP